MSVPSVANLSAQEALLVVPSALEARGLGRPEAALCGIGVVAAALGMGELLARARPTWVVLAGIAGTRDEAILPLGAVIAVEAVLNAAVGAGAGSSFIPLGALGLPAGEELAPDRIALTLPAGSWPGARETRWGVSATVAAASASPEQAAALPRAALIEEMEGYAVALACLRAGVPCTMLRAVSNPAGVRDKSRWDVAGALHALRCALEALGVP